MTRSPLSATICYAPALGCLESHELALVEPLPPERGEAAVRSSGDGILIYTAARSEESGGIVETLGARAAGHHKSPICIELQFAEIGLHGFEHFLGLNLHNVVYSVLADKAGGDSEGVDQFAIYLDLLSGFDREVQVDPFAIR